MSHPLFGPEIRSMLADRDEPGLKAFCESLHPATAAEALEDDEFAPGRNLGRHLPGRHPHPGRHLRISAARPGRWKWSRAGSGRRSGLLIGKMSHDDRVDLLRRLPSRVKESLLRLVDEADRRDIATLFTYAENSVGALMTTDYAWLPPTLTAAEAVDQLRQQAPDKETIYYIYILDEPRKRADGGGMVPRPLLGVISLRDLILAPRQTLLRDLMGGDELVAVKLSDDRETAAETLAQYDFIALPVLDDGGGMVGIITHDDVIDVIRQEATEDLQKQAGGRRRVGRPGTGRPACTGCGGAGRKWLSRAVRGRTRHLLRHVLLRGGHRHGGGAQPVRAAVHLGGRQLRHPGVHRRHPGAGPGRDRAAADWRPGAASANCWSGVALGLTLGGIALVPRGGSPRATPAAAPGRSGRR